MPDGEPNQQRSKILKLVNKVSLFFKFKSNGLQKNQQSQKGSKDNIIDYQKLKAEDIMIPRADIVAIDSSSSLDEISQIFLDSRHTRMPVYKQTLDNIIGFINIKDILPFLLKPQDHIKFSIDKALRDLLIVPPSMKIFNLLEKMRQTCTHIALVADEFGGADGLITIEDLVEELIGKIDDEYDQDADSEFKQISDNSFEVSGRLEIKTLEEKLKLNLSDGDAYETVAGLILSIMGHVPSKGEIITHVDSGLKLKILDSNPRRIIKVLLST